MRSLGTRGRWIALAAFALAWPATGLFLRRFTEGAETYAHFDIYGWQPSAAPGRPRGGVGQGMRAILHALPAIA